MDTAHGQRILTYNSKKIYNTIGN